MKAADAKSPKVPLTGLLKKRLQEVGFIFLTVLALFFFIALITYRAADPAWTHAVSSGVVHNAGGIVGAYLSSFFLYLLGFVAYIFPLLVLLLAFSLLTGSNNSSQDANFNGVLFAMRLLGFLFILSSGAALSFLLFFSSGHILPFGAGGVLGYEFGRAVLYAFKVYGSLLILFALFFIGVTLLTGLSWLSVIESVGALLCSGFKKARALKKEKVATQAQHFSPDTVVTPTVAAPPNKKRAKERIVALPEIIPPTTLSEIVKPKRKKKLHKPKSIVKEAVLPDSLRPEPGDLPVLSLLDEVKTTSHREYSEQELATRSRLLELRLSEFGVEGKVMAVHPGPVVTRFELDLAAGTKVGKLSGLSKDLARALSVVSVRIVEVIPGKSYVGLELPNEVRDLVNLREVLSSRRFEDAVSPLSLALGKDIGGHPVVVDLAKMPHLLVAGTTGSGKSVGLNTMLMSLLFKSKPEELRLIMIDPKMLELSVYDDIPHLLAPVVTDMNNAATALRWCVVEMERRYKLMAALGVRNLAGYNAKVKKALSDGAPLLDPLVGDDAAVPPTPLEVLPQIVVLADEFADMMVVVGKKVETLIARLAQKARAAGIHLILATQRPSVDVITGLIKANIPTRIAFQVSSKIDSRTILDQAGADQLLGHGDMLYLAPGSGMPVRVHGAFVSDEEVHRVVSYLKMTGSPDYLDDVLDDTSGDAGSFINASLGKGSADKESAEQDSYYDEAVDFVARSRRVSISSVQRRFKIGYNRAANIVEAMEAAGVVSSLEGSGQRQVLVPPPAD